MKKTIFIILIIIVSLFLSGCTQESICGDGICDFIEQNPNSPFYCPKDCEVTDCICPTNWEPVCGVDGQTYQNTCQAECNNIEIAYEGECGNEEQSKIAWKNAQPWAITDWAMTNKQLELTIKNNTFQTLSLIKIKINDFEGIPTYTQFSQPLIPGKDIAPGEQTKVKIDFNEPCSPNNVFKFEKEKIFIEYKEFNSPQENLIMNGIADIIGTCQEETLQDLNLNTNMIISKTEYGLDEEVKLK